MLPIVSIVGQSQSGKTTLVERLIGEFKGAGIPRGYGKACLQGLRY